MMEEVNSEAVFDILDNGETVKEEDLKTVQPSEEENKYVTVPYKCSNGIEKIVHYGWAWKWSKSKIGKVFWLKRIFILDETGKLYYFKSVKSKKPCKPPLEISEKKFWRSKVKRNCLQIERASKPFYFYFETQNERLVWSEMFSRIGAIKTPPPLTEERKPEIVNRNVKKWTEGQVLDWMDFVPLDGRQTLLDLYQDNFRGVDGPKLLKFKDRDLRQRKIRNRKHRRITKGMIDILRKDGTFDLGFHTCLRKLTDMLNDKRGHVEGTSRVFLARNLSIPSCMRKTYLNLKEFAKTLKLNEIIKEGSEAEDEDENEGEINDEDGKQDQDEEEEEKDPKESAISQRLEDLKNEMQGMGTRFSMTLRREPDPKEQLELKAQKEEDMILHSNQMSIQTFEKEIGRFPVKLVITEVTTSNRYKTARKLISPVMTMIPHLKQEFGLFHTALIVGPWYLEWNDSSIIIPRQLFSSMALLSADIEFTVGLKQQSLKEVTKILSDVICKWNREKTYRNVPMSDTGPLGNCQQFVEEVMERLGLFIKSDGCFGRYMEQMRKKGCCTITFDPTPEFREKFKLDEIPSTASKREHSYTFRTHLELDDFVNRCCDIDELSLNNDYKDSFKLLKSFDRAFWLRYLKAPCDRYKPAEKNGKVNCPFDDPRNTKSFVNVNSFL